jgi:tetratricopeptide (TPR) repeat protein
MTAARRLFLPLPFSACLVALLAAAPTPDDPPDELIRRANAAFLREDIEAADALYAAAEERTADPGLVAFNKAAVLFAQGRFRDAELHYARVLDDRACPPDRAARAWYNRGTCLLRRGGPPTVYRSAAACFERCLALHPHERRLRDDARENLELAKLLWAEANKKADKPDDLSEPPPELAPEPPPLGGGSEPDVGPDGPGGDGPKDPRATQQPATGPVPKGGAAQTDQQTPGNNANLPVIADDAQPQNLSPEDTREYLKRTDARLRDERAKMLRMLYGPDRPGVRDW